MARASKFDFQHLLRTFDRKTVEMLYDVWLRSGGAPAPSRDLIQVNTFVESVEAEAQGSSGDTLLEVRLKRAERRIADLEAQIEH